MKKKTKDDFPYTLAELTQDLKNNDVCGERAKVTIAAYDRAATDSFKEFPDEQAAALVTLLEVGAAAHTNIPLEVLNLFAAELVPVFFKLSVGLALVEGYVIKNEKEQEDANK